MKRRPTPLRHVEGQLEIFKRFVETSGQALGMADLEGRVFFVNATLCRLLGEENPEAVYQHNLFDFYPPETAARIQEEILPLVREHGQWVWETCLIDKTGRTTPIIENVFLLKDDTGSPLCFATVMTDISERIRMEAEFRTCRDQLEDLVSQRTAQLEESNVLLHAQIEKYQQTETLLSRLIAILDSTSDLVGAASPDGQGLYMNAAGRRMTGFGADEDLSKRNMAEVHPAWAWPDVEEGIQKAIKQGVWEGETVVVNHQNGREIPVSQVIMAHRGSNGEVEYLSTILRDISDRKRAEEALRESEEKLRTIVDNMQDAYYRCDLNGELLYTTASAARLLGCSSAEEMIGLKIKDFYYSPGEAEEQYKILQSGGKITKYEVTLKRRDNGEPVIVLANSQFFYDSGGNIAGIEGVYSDITELKRSEAALKKRILALTRPLDSATEITIEELFDIDDIQRLQDEFSRATGVASIITHTDGTPITTPSNFCRLCIDIIRKTDKGLANCYTSDAVLGRASTQGPCIQPCMSGGLWDAGAGITVGGRHIANWLIGQVRDETQTEENMRRYAREIGADEQAVVEAFREVPAMSREQFRHVSQALFTFANLLSNIAYQNVQQARFITERRQAEEALRKSEEKYRRIVETANEGMWMLDADTRTTVVNTRIAEMIGYPEEEIIGRSFEDFLFEEDKADHAQRMAARRQGISESYERRLRHRDGQAVFVLISAAPIFDDEHHFQGSFAMFTDITERKQAEEELQKLASVVMHCSELVNIATLDGKMIYLNDAAQNMLGISADEVAQTHITQVIPDHLMEKVQKEVLPAMMAGGWEGELECKNLKSGALTPVYATIFLVKDSKTGAPLYHVNVSLDITERKRLEEELIKAQRLDSIGTLAGGIAHDFNNLLTAIMGNLELARMRMAETDEAYPRLQKAEKAVKSARDLTQRLITFSKGGYPMGTVMPLRELITESVGLALSGSNTSAVWNFAADLPAVEIDENQIRQAIHNIVINAQEAMPRGGTLTVEAQKTALESDNPFALPAGIYVRLAFRDEGRGIPAEDLPKIFDPYFTTKAMGSTKGLGLSLPICYSIIKRHGGHILVESQEGVGTTVTIYLPAAQEQ